MTRPDIAYAMSQAATFMSRPKDAHHKAVKRILRYLKGSEKLGIRYQKEDEAAPGCVNIIGYSDASYGDLPKGQSSFGYVFMLSGGAVAWKAGKLRAVSGCSICGHVYKGARLRQGYQRCLYCRRRFGEPRKHDDNFVDCSRCGTAGKCQTLHRFSQ